MSFQSASGELCFHQPKPSAKPKGKNPGCLKNSHLHYLLRFGDPHITIGGFVPSNLFFLEAHVAVGEELATSGVHTGSRSTFGAHQAG